MPSLAAKYAARVRRTHSALGWDVMLHDIKEAAFERRVVYPVDNFSPDTGELFLFGDDSIMFLSHVWDVTAHVPTRKAEIAHARRLLGVS